LEKSVGATEDRTNKNVRFVERKEQEEVDEEET
jgi:hypothetical protein